VAVTAKLVDASKPLVENVVYHSFSVTSAAVRRASQTVTSVRVVLRSIGPANTRGSDDSL
jgi:hypothetical protein